MQHYSSYQPPKGKHMSSDMKWARTIYTCVADVLLFG